MIQLNRYVMAMIYEHGNKEQPSRSAGWKAAGWAEPFGGPGEPNGWLEERQQVSPSQF